MHDDLLLQIFKLLNISQNQIDERFLNRKLRVQGRGNEKSLEARIFWKNVKHVKLLLLILKIFAVALKLQKETEINCFYLQFDEVTF